MSREEIEKWNAKYRAGVSNPRVAGAPTPLLDRLPADGGLALDLGTGLMRHARGLAERGFRVLAVDAAREAFRAAGPVPEAIQRLVADLDHWIPPAETFDAIVDVHYLNRALCPHLEAALRPGGRLAFEIRVDSSQRIGDITKPFRLAPGEAVTLFPRLRCLEVHEEESEETVGLGRYLFQAG